MARKILWVVVVISFILFLVINIPSPIQIEGDGVFYYSYLRSVMFDRDLDFKNELEHFSAYDYFSRQFVEESKVTEIGKTPNAYAWGVGLMWLPFVAIAHLLTLLFRGVSDGFSSGYVWAVNFGSWVYGMLALIMVFQILKKFFSDKVAFLSSLVVWLATPWLYYQFFEPSMSHMASLFLVTGFLLLLIRQWKSQKVPALLMATMILLMVATRWQNAIFLIAFLPLIWRSKYKIREILVLVVPIVIFVVIQMAIWRHLYGVYLLVPQGHQFVGYHFYGLRTLFSSDRGLFLWSPVIVLAVIGWFHLPRSVIARRPKADEAIPTRSLRFARDDNNRSFPWAWMILVVGVGQWLINSSLNDPGGGDAYGARRFIELFPFFAIALSALFEKLKRFKWQLITLVVILILWNGLLIQNYRHNLIPRSGEFQFFQHNYLNTLVPNSRELGSGTR